MGSIDEFLETFKDSRKEYLQIETELGTQVRALCDRALKGHRYLLETRVKEIDSLEMKLRGRRHLYDNESQNVKDIKDLVGGRIILASQLDIGHVEKVIKENFNVKGTTQHPQMGLNKNQRFRGYSGLHFHVIWRQPPIERYQDLIIEIQVMSAFMWAFSTIEHDIEYKHTHGMPSNEVKISLEVIKGIVNVGELAILQFESSSSPHSETLNRQ